MTNLTATISEIAGEPALVFTSPPPAGAPPALRAALARREKATRTGVCECGAQVVIPNRATRRKAARTGETLEAVMTHAADCTAADEAISRIRRAALS